MTSTAPPPGPALAVRDLRKHYAGRAVVDRITFAAPSAQVTAVLGPNGAGKTTLIEICEGLRRPDGGTVTVLGLDPHRDGARLRPRIGVMLQDGGLPTGARTAELLGHVAALHADPLPTTALLADLGLTAHARTTVRRLSGGQRQRLALALAVVGRPEIVFLDEPGAGLDPQARQAVWALVEALTADGVTVLLTTHAMDEAQRLAQQVVVIDRGRIVAHGSPDDLIGPGEHLEFTAAADLDLTALAARLAPTATVAEDSPGHYTVRATTGAELATAALAVVTTWCAETGIRPQGLALTRRTLEDVFLELTGRSLR